MFYHNVTYLFILCQENPKVMTWNQTKNPDFAVCSASEFLKDEFVPQEVRDSYQQFIDSVDVTKVQENDRGYKDFEWEGVDEQAKKRYTVTWNERFKFGAMRGPLPKWWKPKDKEEKEKVVEPPEGQKTLEQSVSVDLTETNRLLGDIKELMESLLAVMGGPKPVKPVEAS